MCDVSGDFPPSFNESGAGKLVPPDLLRAVTDGGIGGKQVVREIVTRCPNDAAQILTWLRDNKHYGSGLWLLWATDFERDADKLVAWLRSRVAAWEGKTA